VGKKLFHDALVEPVKNVFEENVWIVGENANIGISLFQQSKNKRLNNRAMSF
jgi:hypothetical protein